MYVTCFYLWYSCYFWPSKLNFGWLFGGCISLHFGRNLNPQSREPWKPWDDLLHITLVGWPVRPEAIPGRLPDRGRKNGRSWKYLRVSLKGFFFFKYLYYSNWWIPSTRFWRWIFLKTNFHVLHLWGLGYNCWGSAEEKGIGSEQVWGPRMIGLDRVNHQPTSRPL